MTTNASQGSINQQIFPLIPERFLSELPEPPLTYTDIGAAVRKGTLVSGAEHFETIGAEEFRAPSAGFLPDALEWKKAVGKSIKAD